MAGHTAPVSSVALTEDGRMAVSLSFDGTLKLWDLGRCAGDVVHRGHMDALTAIVATRGPHLFDRLNLRQWRAN